MILPCGDGGRSITDLHRDHHPAGPLGRVRQRGPGHVPDPVERIGDHVRRGQDHHHRRREPHLRPGPSVRIPVPGHPGSLGLAHRHPAGVRQRRRGHARRDGRSPRAARQEPRPGHRGRGILHRRPPSRDPLRNILPRHSLILAGSARRRSRRRRPRRAAHPQRSRTAAPSKRAQKARPKFRHATATKKTFTGKPQVTVFAPGFS